MGVLKAEKYKDVICDLKINFHLPHRGRMDFDRQKWKWENHLRVPFRAFGSRENMIITPLETTIFICL